MWWCTKLPPPLPTSSMSVQTTSRESDRKSSSMTNSNKVLSSGVIPRRQAGNRFYANPTSINRRLANFSTDGKKMALLSPGNTFIMTPPCFQAPVYTSVRYRLLASATFWLPADVERDFRTKRACPCSPSQGRIAIT